MTKTQPIRILIVDDHAVVRAGLASMLSTQPELCIVGSASSGEEALALLKTAAVDILLLDLRMPEMSGIDLLNHLRELSNPPVPIILSNFDLEEDVYAAVHAGARGYLLKDTNLDEMMIAIKAVMSGKRYLRQDLACRLAERMTRPTLTARELEILSMMAQGYTNPEIGHILQISSNTARNHVNSIIEKLEVSDRTAAATAGILRGIIHP